MMTNLQAVRLVKRRMSRCRTNRSELKQLCTYIRNGYEVRNVMINMGSKLTWIIVFVTKGINTSTFRFDAK